MGPEDEAAQAAADAAQAVADAVEHTESDPAPIVVVEPPAPESPDTNVLVATALSQAHAEHEARHTEQETRHREEWDAHMETHANDAAAIETLKAENAALKESLAEIAAGLEAAAVEESGTDEPTTVEPDEAPTTADDAEAEGTHINAEPGERKHWLTKLGF